LLKKKYFEFRINCEFLLVGVVVVARFAMKFIIQKFIEYLELCQQSEKQKSRLFAKGLFGKDLKLQKDHFVILLRKILFSIFLKTGEFKIFGGSHFWRIERKRARNSHKVLKIHLNRSEECG
jgi:hypothetical protein